MKRGHVIFFIILITFLSASFYTMDLDTLGMLMTCGPKERLRGPLEWSDESVLRSLRFQYLVPPSSLSLNLTKSDQFLYSTHKSEFGWDFYDHYNKQFFSDQKRGFFIEAGALDGEFMSNSLWLEQSQGWSGLLIEADPANFQHLVWKRRKAWLSNTCISEKTYPREALFESLQQRSLTLAVPWLFRANTREINSYFNKVQDFSQFSAMSYVKVQCFPLASYLLALNVSTVDYMSLDIQGHEWDVIKTLPLQDMILKVLAIEHFMEDAVEMNEGRKVDDKFLQYMKSIHYRLIDVYENTNYIFVLESDPLANRTISKFKNTR